MTTAPLFERIALVPNTLLGVWVAVFYFSYEGIDYDARVSLGKLEDLTVAEARAIMDSGAYREEMRQRFITVVHLPTRH